MLKAIRSQPVLTAAFIAALITVFIVPPDKEYAGYINFPVLIELFGLMTAVAGFRMSGLFERATSLILKKAGNIRAAALLLIFSCMFSAMAVTNDVALLTFVPLTLLIFRGADDNRIMILTIVLETAAANLGGMLTPIGNPQNLFLYDKYSFTAGEFIKAVLPAGIISIVIITALCFLLPSRKCSVPSDANTPIDKKKAILCGILFVICLLTVFKVVPELICLAAAILIALIADRKIPGKVDYSLLVTFLFFFIFVGNIARIDTVRTFFSDILTGREILISALLSQFISNVPAAVMLSGFTSNGRELLTGVNIGGFGTPVASLASLISFQFYRKSSGAKSGKYMLWFSAVNFGMLIILLLIHCTIIR